jgi:hypothetical protein
MNDELITQFTPETFGEWCREKFDRFTSDPHPVSDPGDFARAEIVGYVQSLPDAETNRPLLVMAVHAGEKINERSSRRRQFDFARKQLQAAIDTPPAKVKGLFTQGLFAFYDSAGDFRLSLVTGRAEGRKLVYSDFKRQSFFVAPARENKTFRARTSSSFTTWKNLVEAFSVETLTKEFYNSLFAWYERAMAPASKVSFPNDLARDDDDRLMLSEHLIRLITRLMFVWFIRQKKLVPKELFDTGDLRQLLTRFDALSPKQDNYYRAILQNLFFATLNCEIGEREFAREGSFLENKEHFGIKLLYRYRDEFACPTNKVIELFRTVPFLNGGLFECLDKQTAYQDGFSRNPKRRAHIPNSLFFDDAGLITLFARYDFTVDENSPNDADVALDPELLGKVFENLLGAYNPETRQTARKQSGSFYTPREIVNYMVNESLVAHLRTKVPEAEEPAIRALLSEEDPPPLAELLRRKMVEALYHCRILDPACGSGAFPMGVLLKMVQLLQRLDEKNALWREIVLTEADKALAEAENLDAEEKSDRRRRITESFDQSVNEPDYARKLYLIENCIFGVDIQSIAVQIAKLRAFITLVCDQRPTADPAKNYGMLPLPNLETKFVAANTLIGLEADFADGLKTADDVSLLNDPELHRLRADLAEVRHRHFRARNAPEKNKCRAQDERLRGKIKARLVEIASKPNAEKIALWQVEIGKLQQHRKEAQKEDWREVIQTQPIQGDMFETGPKPVQTTLRVDVNKERRDRIDDDIRRFTRDIETEKNRARNKSAFQHEADRLAAWDPYDQNASSPFFDPEWMFDVKDGFDIVIGNPPYVLISKEVFVTMYGAQYPLLSGKPDLYRMFIERGSRLVLQAGTLSFIVPNTLMAIPSAQRLRESLTRHTSIQVIIDLVSPVFGAAAVNNIILQFSKRVPDDAVVLVGVADGEDALEHLSQLSRVPQAKWLANSRCEWTVHVSGHAEALIGKLQSDAIRLANVLDDLTLGMQVYHNTIHSQTQMEARCHHATTKRGRWWLPEYGGRHLADYAVRTEVRVPFVNYSATAIYQKPDHRFFSGPRLILREIVGDRLAIAYADEEFVVNKSCYVLRSHKLKPMDLKALQAILTSACVAFWVHLKGDKAKQALFPRITMNTLKAIPVPGSWPEHRQALASGIDRILAVKRAQPAADTSALEREIDAIVYRLYGLTPDEIAIVEGREPGAKKAPAATKPTKASAGARKARKSVLTEDPDLA